MRENYSKSNIYSSIYLSKRELYQKNREKSRKSFENEFVISYYNKAHNRYETKTQRDINQEKSRIFRVLQLKNLENSSFEKFENSRKICPKCHMMIPLSGKCDCED